MKIDKLKLDKLKEEAMNQLKSAQDKFAEENPTHINGLKLKPNPGHTNNQPINGIIKTQK